MVTLGIDEVGRGCWAGPLVVGAVILERKIPGLTDSKQLSKKRRIELDKQIRESAKFVGLGWVEPKEIDRLGLTASMKLAIERALKRAPKVDQIIIDGNVNYLAENPNAIAQIKADQAEPAVSAASIVAKVARDGYMSDVAKSHPDFGFEKHAGYGTALHKHAIQTHGLTPLHRRSFKPIRALSGTA